MLGALFRPVEVGRIFSIPIRVMPVVLVLLAVILATASTANFTWLLFLLAVLTISLLAHELGHAVAARKLGLHVQDILILPHGGAARVEPIADKPELETLVALAGPAVNLVFAAILWPIPGVAASYAMAINLTLGLGNLVPAFPLDGGRVLRAWLNRSVPLPDATRAAVGIASWIAVIALVVAAMNEALLLGLFLAGYIWFFSRQELLQVILTSGRAPAMTMGEVFRVATRATWRSLVAGITGSGAPKPAEPRAEEVGGEPTADAEPRDPHEPVVAEAEPVESELERFHGSLDEFFDRRRPS